MLIAAVSLANNRAGSLSSPRAQGSASGGHVHDQPRPALAHLPVCFEQQADEIAREERVSPLQKLQDVGVVVVAGPIDLSADPRLERGAALGQRRQDLAPDAALSDSLLDPLDETNHTR